MSLNHICKDGLRDIDLDVKSLSIQGQVVTPGGGGGGGSLDDAYDQGNIIFTVGGLPVDIQGTAGLKVEAGVTTDQTVFNADQQLVTKKFVDDSITLQNAYENGTGQISLTIGKPLEISGNEGVNVNGNSVTTTKLTFNNSQELVSKQYVDDSVQSLGRTTVLFNQSQDYLVVNGGFYTDGVITLGWDAVNQTEFLVNTLPSTGGVTVSSLNGGTGTSIIATQANFKYDIGGLVAASGILQSWIHANTDASYPNYYITILRLGGGENSILTVEKY